MSKLKVLAGIAVSILLSLAVLVVPAQAEFLYVSSFLGGDVKKVDATQGTFTRFAFVPSGVQEVFDTAGNLYVAATGAGYVARVTPDGQVSVAFSGFTYPSGVAIDAAGDFYVADQGAENVTKLDPNGVVLRVTPVSHPFSLAFGPDGNLYIAQTVPGLISRMTPAGDVSPFSSAVFQPSYLAFAANGDLFVSSVYYATVTRIRSDGTSSIFVNLGGGGNQVAGLEFAANGDLYASQPETGKILRVTPAAQVSVVATGLYYPNDVVVGPRIRGDMNCDGSVNPLDIPAFVLALTDPAGYAATYPSCSILAGELNGDGLEDGMDIGTFVQCVLNDGCP